MTGAAEERRAALFAGRAPDSIRIVVRMPNWLGDCIMAMPALRFLRESFPAAEIVAACRETLRGFAAAQPDADAVVIAPGPGWRGFSALLRGGSAGGGRVFPEDADLGVLFTNSLSTALWMWRAGAKCRLGYNRDSRRVFLTHPVPCDGRVAALHFIEYYLELSRRAVAVVKSWKTRAIDVREVAVDKDFLVPRIAVGADGEKAASRIVAEAGFGDQYAVIAPASAYGPVKDWPPGHYRQLARFLVEQYEMPVFVTGGAGQFAVCEGVAAGGGGRIVNLAGKTGLDAFLGLTAGAALFVGGDSGGAHAAAAFGVPTLVIFGITNPARTKPVGDNVFMLGAGEERDVRLSTVSARVRAQRALSGIDVSRAAAAVDIVLND